MTQRNNRSKSHSRAVIAATVEVPPLPLSPFFVTTVLLLLAVLIGATAAQADPYAEGDLSSYAYVEVLDGRGRVEQAWDGSTEALDANYPLSSGDRVQLEAGARLSLVLPDRTRVRVSGPADFTLRRLALARDEASAVSELEIFEGELQVVVDEDFLGDQLPIITTHAGGFLVHEAGEYVFYTDGDWTAATTRSGYLELSTDRGSAVVRADEMLTVEGARWPRISTRVAGSQSSLEVWAAELDYERAAYASGYVDRSLWHSSAPLERNGSWVQVGGRHAWHPRVASGWRPYYDGRWVTTRSGYTWVSSEPWGWLTYHYGAWDFSAGLGWVWYPGRVYSPAWVYWHWSPDYVGWVPTGYYSSHYGGLHLGIHGWSRASWSTYSYWNFCRTRDVGRADFRGYVTTGSRLGRTARSREVPRGIVTTDTRPIDPRELDRPGEFAERIAKRRNGGSVDHIDVSRFVSREESPERIDGRVHTRAAAPRSQPRSEQGSGLNYRAPVLEGRAVPGEGQRRVSSQGGEGAQQTGRQTGGVTPTVSGVPRSRMRWSSPDGENPRAGVSYPADRRRVRTIQVPEAHRPREAGAPQVSEPERGESPGSRVMERIRNRREVVAPTYRPPAPRAAPSAGATGSGSASSPQAAPRSAPRAAPSSRTAPPPRRDDSSRSRSSSSSDRRSSGQSRSESSASSNRSSSGSSSSDRSSGSSSSSARRSRPPRG